jgi:flavodoxin short chain
MRQLFKSVSKQKKMTNALIVYASLTGTTEGIAQLLAQELRALNIEVLVKECTEVYPKEFLEYDLCVMATYTYGSDGAIPEESEDFFFDLEEVDLKGKIFGVLGSGDRIYDKFCPAVDDFDEQFQNTGATRGAKPLKINLSPNQDDKERIKRFAKNLVGAYSKIRKH